MQFHYLLEQQSENISVHLTPLFAETWGGCTPLLVRSLPGLEVLFQEWKKHFP